MHGGGGGGGGASIDWCRMSARVLPVHDCLNRWMLDLEGDNLEISNVEVCEDVTI